MLAWNEAEKAIVRDWMQAKTTEAREDCWYKLQALKEAHRSLNGFLEHGKDVARKKQKRNDGTKYA